MKVKETSVDFHSSNNPGEQVLVKVVTVKNSSFDLWLLLSPCQFLCIIIMETKTNKQSLPWSRGKSPGFESL